MHLRSYKEKSKDELSRDFFNVPGPDSLPGPGDPPSVTKVRARRSSTITTQDVPGTQGMEINAVLSVEGKEEVYVGLSRVLGVELTRHRPAGSAYCRLSSALSVLTGGAAAVRCPCTLSDESSGKSAQRI